MAMVGRELAVELQAPAERARARVSRMPVKPLLQALGIALYQPWEAEIATLPGLPPVMVSMVWPEFLPLPDAVAGTARGAMG